MTASTLTRTDIHRAASEAFDPESYDLVGVFDLHPEDGNNRERIEEVNAQLKLGNSFAGAPYGSGRCSHCGAHLRYCALMVHAATKTLLYIGETCLDNRFSLSKVEFKRLREAAKVNRERRSRDEVFAALCEEYPALVWASYANNIAQAGATYEEVTYDRNWTVLEETADSKSWVRRTKMGEAIYTLGDMARRAHRYGAPTAKAYAYCESLVNKLTQAQERLDRYAAEATERVNAYQGEIKKRYDFTGTVRFTTLIDGFYGEKTLVVIDTPAGTLKWWATGNRQSELARGSKVTVKATVKAFEEYNGELQTVITNGKIQA